MKLQVLSVALEVPQKKVSNNDIAESLDTSDEWIYSHTGIKYRFIAEGEKASDLGAAAARKALSSAGMTAAEVDMIIVATSTPDYLSFPATACVIQEKLGIASCIAYDLSAACSGFVYAFSAAANAMRAGEVQNALIIGSEIFSSIVNWQDRSTCILFGDGAGAALLSNNPKKIHVSKELQSDVISSFLCSTAKDNMSLVRVPEKENEEENSAHYVEMNGRKVYTFAINAIVETMQTLCKKSGMSIDDIDYIVPHQANSRIISAAASRLKVPEEKFFINIKHYANTSAASIPIALADMRSRGLLKRGASIAMVGFGAGLTYGGVLLRW